jgi:hypothetical protein
VGDIGESVKEYDVDGLLRLKTENARERNEVLSPACGVFSGARTNCVICVGVRVSLLIFAMTEVGEGG